MRVYRSSESPLAIVNGVLPKDYYSLELKCYNALFGRTSHVECVVLLTKVHKKKCKKGLK